METKKVLLYTGGALVLGAVGFFVWSFFQKVDIPLGNTTITLGSEPKPNEEANNSSNNANSSTSPILAQNTSSGNSTFNPNVNNPFQNIEDDSTYSGLDSFIHRGV